MLIRFFVVRIAGGIDSSGVLIEIDATPTNSATSTFDMMLLNSGAINTAGVGGGIGGDVMSFSGTGSTSAGATSSSGGEGSSGGGGIYASAAAVERLPPVGTWKKRPPPSLNTTR